MCKVFSSFGRRDDVVTLMTRVMKCVASYYYRDPYFLTVRKQMPVCLSTLTKKFYLNRNKDRDLLLRIIDKLDTIETDIKEIKQKMSEVKN